MFEIRDYSFEKVENLGTRVSEDGGLQVEIKARFTVEIRCYTLLYVTRVTLIFSNEKIEAHDIIDNNETSGFILSELYAEKNG